MTKNNSNFSEAKISFKKSFAFFKENQNFFKNKLKNEISSKQEVVSVTYEEIGLFPRSFSRVTDRFLQQIFSDVENLIIHEYRFYRYLFFTTFKSLLILFFVPILINFFAKNYFVRPLTEYLWNSKQTEIFLNTYQQKRAFLELKDFEEQLYFESLILYTENTEDKKPINLSHSNKIVRFENIPFLNKTIQNMNEISFKIKTKNLNSEDIKKKELNIINSFAFISEKFEKKKIIEMDILLKKNFSFPKIKEINKSFSLINLKKKNIFISKNLYKDHKFLYNFAKKKFSLKLIKDLNLNIYKFNVPFFNINRISFQRNNSTVLKLQEKIMQLAIRYNNLSIEAITNFFSDLISFLTLCYLLFALEIQVNITKSFLLEVFFGLDDSKKSLLILLVTDLLVGYHSSNIWELFFEFIFDHYGFAESQTGVFLLVATLPVLLDVLFKYLIFRHLNRSSPATVATYHAMIE